MEGKDATIDWSKVKDLYDEEELMHEEFEEEPVEEKPKK